MRSKGFVFKKDKEVGPLRCKETGMVKRGGRKGVFGRVALVGVVLGVVLALGLPGAGWAATITVTSTADVVNDADGTCTLREAIRAANSNTAVDACTAGSGTDEIVFAASINGIAITLKVSGTDDTAAAGDLDLTQSVNITGNGPANTLIEACTVDQKAAVCPVGQGIADRVFDVRSGTVSISGVTIRNGRSNQGGTLNLKNTIVANNNAPTSPDCEGSVSSQGNNLIENTSGCSGLGGTDITGQDPNLGPLADNDGPTQTHALLTGSPAIDAGTDTGCPPTDQRGFTRPKMAMATA